MVDMEFVRERIDYLLSDIEKQARKCGRNPDEIRLMAVSKNHDIAAIRAVLRAGIDLFGENRVLEAREKFSTLNAEAEVHLIGHLQRNKAKLAAALFSCIQSIDKASTLKALAPFLKAENKVLDILIEMNTAGEPSKMGLSDEDALYSLVDEVMGYDCFRLKGLMTLAPFTNDEQRIRASFRSLRHFFELLLRKYPGLSPDVLSMGMSSDYLLAIEEGSTLVRIGTAIFGERV